MKKILLFSLLIIFSIFISSCNRGEQKVIFCEDIITIYEENGYTVNYHIRMPNRIPMPGNHYKQKSLYILGECDSPLQLSACISVGAYRIRPLAYPFSIRLICIGREISLHRDVDEIPSWWKFISITREFSRSENQYYHSDQLLCI